MGHNHGVVPDVAKEAVREFLGRLDRALPGRIEGFYIVGSASLGAFRAGRSDIDFVAVVDRPLEPAELRALQRAARRSWTMAVCRDGVLCHQWPLVCNGIYVTGEDLTRSSLRVSPIAAHVAGQFSTHAGFDANPVTWQVLRRHGIVVRGPHPTSLSVYVDDRELRAWTRENLNDYWQRWIETVSRRAWPPINPAFRRGAAWGVLGASRLHYTVATGEVISKEAAGRYALERFGTRWRAVIEEALAYWSRSPGGPTLTPRRRHQDTLRLVATVIADVNGKPRPP